MFGIDPRKDYTRTVETYFYIYGILSLITLNLAGVLFLWIGGKLRERNNKVRIWTIRLCLFNTLFLVMMFSWVLIFGIEGITVHGLGLRLRNPPLALSISMLVISFVLALLPLIWLEAPGTKAAFNSPRFPGRRRPTVARPSATPEPPEDVRPR